MKTDIPNIEDIYIYTAGDDFTNYTYGPEPVPHMFFTRGFYYLHLIRQDVCF